MPTTRSLACLLAAAAANHCRAQESINHTWTFLEVTAGTNTPVPAPNGRIDPGEAARISLTVTISPAIGSTAAFTPPPPPGVGTIAGLGSVFFDLLTTGAASGTWALLSRPPGWALGGPGVPQPNGSVLVIEAGQYIPLGLTASPKNPIHGIWSGVWTPNSYSPRSVTFYSANVPSGSGIVGSILIQYGNHPTSGAPLYVGKWVFNEHGQVSIPIVPGPATTPILLALATTIPLRRPRATTSPTRAHSAP